MYGRRRYRRRSSYVPRSMGKRYSVENIFVSATTPTIGNAWAAPADGEGNHIVYNIVNPSTFVIDNVYKAIQGMRKAKNFTISWTADQDRPILFALLYLPEGHSAAVLNTTSAVSLYEPNQHVMLSGVFEKGQQNRFSTKLGRNLNSGDSIVLALKIYSVDSISIKWGAHCTYAISF